MRSLLQDFNRFSNVQEEYDATIQSFGEDVLVSFSLAHIFIFTQRVTGSILSKTASLLSC